MSPKPLGERNYEQFAARYAKFAKHKPHNAMYERPATLSLLPPLAGKRVLDAGCGPGLYAEQLLERGAEVVAFDVTPAMVELARERVHGRAELHVADLEQSLHFAADASFDVVLSPLVLDYIADWGPAFDELYRVLKPGGCLVYSHSHPASDIELVRSKVDPAADYFAREHFTMQWGGFGTPQPTVEGYRRPLAQMLNSLCSAGFVLDKLLEPKPAAEMAEVNPRLYEQLMRDPVFLCVRARKPGG